MICFWIITCVFVMLSLGSIYLVFKRKEDLKKYDKIFKILSIVYISLAFIDIFLPDEFSLRFIWDFDYLKENHDPFHAFLRAFNSMAIVTLPISIFFNQKNFKRVASFIILPTTILNICLGKTFIDYYTSSLTYEYATVFGEKLYPFLTNIYFRSILFSLILGMQLLISLYILLNSIEELKMKKNEVLRFVGVALGLFVTNLPISFIQQLTGTVSNITFNMGDPSHIIFMIVVFALPFIFTMIFKKESYESKYVLLLVLSISLMFQYNSFFRTDGIITATRYPLQLCNIAGAFLVVTLLLKSEKMFHFTVVCNVTGALIAIILCDSTKDVGILYCMNIHYMVEHINVFIVPVLCLSLGVFKPLKFRDIKHFVIGFSIYYAAILVIGTIFNGIALGSSNSYFECNYLFMFQKEAATRLVGDFIGAFFDLKITLFKFYNLYLAQILVYLVFLAVCSIIYSVLYLIFKEKSSVQNGKEA